MSSPPKEGAGLDAIVEMAARLSRAAVTTAATAAAVGLASAAALPEPTVALHTLPLQSPDIRTGEFVGVPNLSTVVVMLLFIGSQCANCDTTLSLVRSFFHHANAFERQLEVILVSAHRTVREYKQMLFDLRNPFFAVPYDSPERLRLLEAYGVKYADDGSFEPKLVFLEWLGARNQHLDPFPVARECFTIRNTTGFISDMRLPEIRLPVNTATRATSYKFTRPVEYTATTVISNDYHYPPADRVQTIREHCAFFFEDVRDTLYGMKGHLMRQWKYVQSLMIVTDRMLVSATERKDDAESIEVYNKHFRKVADEMNNPRLLQLLGATIIALPDGDLSGRLSEPPAVDLDYFRNFLQRQLARLVPFVRDEGRLRKEAAARGETPAAIPRAMMFPILKTHAVKAPMYELTLKFRSRTWLVVRDRFPKSSAELKELFAQKVFNDPLFRLETVRLFSEELNPHRPIPGTDMFPSGETAVRGSVIYESLSEIQPLLDERQRRSRDQQLVRITVVAIGSMNLYNQVKPATDRANVMRQIEALQDAAGAIDFESLWLQESMTSAAIVAKLAELDSLQEEILRFVPVVELHINASREVNERRAQAARTPVSESPTPSSTAISPPGPLSEIGDLDVSDSRNEDDEEAKAPPPPVTPSRNKLRAGSDGFSFATVSGTTADPEEFLEVFETTAAPTQSSLGGGPRVAEPKEATTANPSRAETTGTTVAPISFETTTTEAPKGRNQPRTYSELNEPNGAGHINYPEIFLRHVVHWFGSKFFSWLPANIECMSEPDDCAPCSGTMQMHITRLQRNQELDQHGRRVEYPGVLGSFIVERYKCMKCQALFSLHRAVHDLERMIEFPQGRCGEHGKVFAVLARALGFDTRIVVGRFREKDPTASIGFFGAGDLDHLWNEVYIDERSEWVHVDVSASDDAPLAAGSLGIPSANRFDAKHGIEESAGALLIAGAVSKDGAALVTNKYISSSTDAGYAAHQQDDSRLRADVEALSGLIGATLVNVPLSETIEGIRQVYIRQMAERERVELDNKFWLRQAPKVGIAVGPVRGPGGSVLEFSGEPIPDWDKRRPGTLFQTYDALMRMDSAVSWRVCRVEVSKVGALVARVLFRYCVNFSQSPSNWAVSEDDFGLEESELPPLPAEAVVTEITIPRGDYIARVDTVLTPEGLLSDFNPVLGSALPDADQHSVVGFYGAHRHASRLGIEHIGFYRVANSQRSPGLVPALASVKDVPDL